MSERPEWASGPEWEGWDVDRGGPMPCMRRRMVTGRLLRIYSDGVLGIGVGMDLPFADPIQALKVATGIAICAAGGWE